MSERPAVPDLSRMFLAALDPAVPMPVDEAARAADPAKIVAIAGRADGEPLHAPLSGRECVWYRAVTSPFREELGSRSGGRTQRLAPPPVVPSSAYPPQQASARRRNEQQIDESTAAFAVRDGAASVRVDPARTLVDAGEVTVNDFRRDHDGWATALLQEWIIAPGADVHAFGAIEQGADGPQLCSGPAPRAIVSSHDREYLTHRARLGVRSASPARLYALILVPVAVAAVLIVLLILGAL